jgi:hypothetical protein
MSRQQQNIRIEETAKAGVHRVTHHGVRGSLLAALNLLERAWR